MAELIEQLASAYGLTVRSESGLQLVRRKDCEKVMEACKSRKLMILGIEAFKLVGNQVEPDVDLIADFSELASEQWDVACGEAQRSAEEFFTKVNKQADLWFEFCLQQH